MTIQPGANVYTQGFGSRPEDVEVPHIDVRAPASTDTRYPIGKRWIFTGNAVYDLIGFTTSNGVTSATWVESAGGSGSVAQLTGDSGTALPVAGSIKIAGTANQITSTASGATVTLALAGPYTPATYTAHGVLLGEGTGSIVATTAGATGTVLAGTTGADPAFTGSPSVSGSLTAGTTITATSGNITATSGNFVSSAAGNGIVLNSGTASGTTTATLNGRSGQVTITTPTINAGSTFSFALTNSSITGSSTQVLYGLTGGTTGSAITIQSVTNSGSTSTVVVQNASAVTNSTGSLVLTFLVLN